MNCHCRTSAEFIDESCNCRGRTKDPLLCPYSNVTPPPIYPSFELDGLSYSTATSHQCTGHVRDQNKTTASTDSSDNGNVICGSMTSPWEVSALPKSVEASFDDLSVCESSNCMPGQCISVPGQVASVGSLLQRHSTSIHLSNTGTGQINSPSHTLLNNSVK